MAVFQPGQSVPGQEFVPRQMIAEEAWGELWRADYRGQRVLLVAYTTAEGDQLFAEAQPMLERWKSLAGTTCPHLLRLLLISDSAIPYTLVEDPGDMTLREYLASEPKGLPPVEQARLGKHVALGLHEAGTYDAGPVGISPDTIFRNPLDRENAWKLLPVAPRCRAVFSLLAGGKYAPPEMAFDSTPWERINADSFSLAWLWAEVIRKSFTGPLPPPADAVPYKALRYLLESCLVSKGGVYGDPRMTALGVERWIKHDAENDFKNLKKDRAAAKRGPVGNALLEGLAWAKRLALPVIILGALGVGGYFAWANADKLNPFAVVNTTKTPMGMASLYYEALIARDVDKLRTVTNEDGARQTFSMLKTIADLERDGWIGRFSTAVPRVSGSGNTRSSESMLLTEDGVPVGLCQLQLQLMPGGDDWKVTAVFFKQLVFPTPGVTPPARRGGGGGAAGGGTGGGGS